MVNHPVHKEKLQRLLTVATLPIGITEQDAAIRWSVPFTLFLCTLHRKKRETNECWNYATSTISVICIIPTRQLVSEASVHYNSNLTDLKVSTYNITLPLFENLHFYL